MPSELDKTYVGSKYFEVLEGDTFVKMKINSTFVAPTSIEHMYSKAKYDLGLFSNGAKKGDLIAIYGGTIEEDDYADLLNKLAYGTHLERVANQYWCNGVIHCPSLTLPKECPVKWTVLDYVSRGVVGNMINDYWPCTNDYVNCESVDLKVRDGELPCGRTGKLRPVEYIRFFRATRDVPYGQEFIRDVGDSHRKTYLATNYWSKRCVMRHSYPIPLIPLDFFERLMNDVN
jgi:hypothetical protein